MPIVKVPGDDDKLEGRSREPNVEGYLGEIELWELPKVWSQRLEAAEKRKFRPYITVVALLLWALLTLVGLVRVILTGDVSVLIASSVVVAPLTIILGYYFRSN